MTTGSEPEGHVLCPPTVIGLVRSGHCVGVGGTGVEVGTTSQPCCDQDELTGKTMSNPAKSTVRTHSVTPVSENLVSRFMDVSPR
jgi:hypothetical protein